MSRHNPTKIYLDIIHLPILQPATPPTLKRLYEARVRSPVSRHSTVAHTAGGTAVTVPWHHDCIYAWSLWHASTAEKKVTMKEPPCTTGKKCPNIVGKTCPQISVSGRLHIVSSHPLGSLRLLLQWLGWCPAPV